MSAWLHSNSNILMIVGALIIFFSWVTSNAIKAKLDILAAAIQEAKRSEHLEGRLDQLEGSLNSIAVQTFEPRAHFYDTSPEELKYGSALDNFTTTTFNSHQIDELQALCLRQRSYSAASNRVTSVSIDLVRVSTLGLELHQELREEIKKARSVINEVHVLRPRPHEELVRATESIKAFEEAYRQRLLPRVQQIYKELIPMTNARRREIETELSAKKKWALFSSRAALVLYTVGSALALAGQIGDKLLK